MNKVDTLKMLLYEFYINHKREMIHNYFDVSWDIWDALEPPPNRVTWRIHGDLWIFNGGNHDPSNFKYLRENCPRSIFWTNILGDFRRSEIKWP